MRPARQTATQRRQRAQRRGRFAEWLCLWYLRLRGWRILARGWRCPSGEIDILARRGRVLALPSQTPGLVAHYALTRAQTDADVEPFPRVLSLALMIMASRRGVPAPGPPQPGRSALGPNLERHHIRRP